MNQPSSAGLNHGTPGFAWAASRVVAGTSRRAASGGAVPNPSEAAKAVLSAAASSRGATERGPSMDPLSPIPAAKRPRENGEATCALTHEEPGESPALG